MFLKKESMERTARSDTLMVHFLCLMLCGSGMFSLTVMCGDAVIRLEWQVCIIE